MGDKINMIKLQMKNVAYAKKYSAMSDELLQIALQELVTKYKIENDDVFKFTNICFIMNARQLKKMGRLR